MGISSALQVHRSTQCDGRSVIKIINYEDKDPRLSVDWRQIYTITRTHKEPSLQKGLFLCFGLLYLPQSATALTVRSVSPVLACSPQHSQTG